MNGYARPVKVNPEKAVCTIEGKDYPAIGFGTYLLQDAVCTAAVEKALHYGYRIIDTATFYENLESIAKALKSYDRSNIYIISKVWHDKQQPDDLHEDLKTTLQKLRTDYLDAYLLHWPNSAVPISQTLDAMNKLRKEKKIRHIGLSNVNVNHLKRALEVGIPITWVQVEMHPHFCDRALLDFCHDHSIAIQAWAPLNRGVLRDDEALIAIGEKHHKTVSQVALRWIVQHHCLPLPSSKNANHIQENLNIQDFHLSQEEMNQIDAKAFSGTRFRLVEAKGLGFKDEFDFTYDECWPQR